MHTPHNNGLVLGKGRHTHTHTHTHTHCERLIAIQQVELKLYRKLAMKGEEEPRYTAYLDVDTHSNFNTPRHRMYLSYLMRLYGREMVLMKCMHDINDTYTPR